MRGNFSQMPTVDPTSTAVLFEQGALVTDAGLNYQSLAVHNRLALIEWALFNDDFQPGKFENNAVVWPALNDAPDVAGFVQRDVGLVRLKTDTVVNAELLKRFPKVAISKAYSVYGCCELTVAKADEKKQDTMPLIQRVEPYVVISETTDGGSPTERSSVPYIRAFLTASQPNVPARIQIHRIWKDDETFKVQVNVSDNNRYSRLTAGTTASGELSVKELTLTDTTSMRFRDGQEIWVEPLPEQTDDFVTRSTRLAYVSPLTKAAFHDGKLIFDNAINIVADSERQVRLIEWDASVELDLVRKALQGSPNSFEWVGEVKLTGVSGTSFEIAFTSEPVEESGLFRHGWFATLSRSAPASVPMRPSRFFQSTALLKFNVDASGNIANAALNSTSTPHNHGETHAGVVANHSPVTEENATLREPADIAKEPATSVSPEVSRVVRDIPLDRLGFRFATPTVRQWARSVELSEVAGLSVDELSEKIRRSVTIDPSQNSEFIEDVRDFVAQINSELTFPTVQGRSTQLV